jgi:hypothetical protein
MHTQGQANEHLHAVASDRCWAVGMQACRSPAAAHVRRQVAGAGMHSMQEASGRVRMHTWPGFSFSYSRSDSINC